MKNKSIGIIGYASGIGGRVLGAKDGPNKQRELGLFPRLNALGASVKDFGNAEAGISEEESAEIRALFSDEERLANNVSEVYKACRELNGLVKECLEDGNTPLVLGGAHSCSIGTVPAISDFYKDKNIGLIWVDTHADLHTPESSDSKNIHGMSVAFLSGRTPGAFQDLGANKPSVKEENIAYLGLREVDRPEAEYIKNSKINAYTMKDIDIYGVASVVEKAIEAASKDTAGFVVSFDLDVCDPNYAPATGTPCRGGLSFREAHLVMELLHDSGKLLGLEFVEYNPSLDENDITGDLSIALMESAFGKSII